LVQVEAMRPITLTPPPDTGLSPVTVGYQGKWSATASGATAPVVAQDVMRFASHWPVVLNTVDFEALTGQGSITVEGSFVMPAPAVQ
jgi:hypothetical protein